MKWYSSSYSTAPDRVRGRVPAATEYGYEEYRNTKSSKRDDAFLAARTQTGSLCHSSGFHRLLVVLEQAPRQRTALFCRGGNGRQSSWYLREALVRLRH